MIGPWGLFALGMCIVCCWVGYIRILYIVIVGILGFSRRREGERIVGVCVYR